MNGPLEDQYFIWLCARVHVARVPTPSNQYWNLLSQLHHTEFVFTLSGDDNRAEDGRDLRDRFLDDTGLERDLDWYNAPCSVLEMMVAFATKAEFTTDIPEKDWVWRFLENLGLDQCTDASRFDPVAVEEVIDRFIWRTYEPNGAGGLFPLRFADRDQREVEIWYQFSAYIDENGL